MIILNDQSLKTLCILMFIQISGKYDSFVDSEYLLNAHVDVLAKCKDSALPRNVRYVICASKILCKRLA